MNTRTWKIIVPVLLVTAVLTAWFLYTQTTKPAPVVPTPIVQQTPSSTVPVPTNEQTPPTTAPNNQTYPLLSVPFTSQAPFGNWADMRQQDGCEEASALMAVYWVRGKALTPAIAEREILAISDYEQQTYGSYKDTSAEDTNTRILKGYFKYNDAQVRHSITVADIKNELLKGNALVIPMNGQKLGNPYFTAPGPVTHMLVVKGYDPARKQFITNDPGTKRGESYRYDENVLFNAIYDYDTSGQPNPLADKKSMIVIVPTGS